MCWQKLLTEYPSYMLGARLYNALANDYHGGEGKSSTKKNDINLDEKYKERKQLISRLNAGYLCLCLFSPKLRIAGERASPEFLYVNGRGLMVWRRGHQRSAMGQPLYRIRI